MVVLGNLFDIDSRVAFVPDCHFTLFALLVVKQPYPIVYCVVGRRFIAINVRGILIELL